MTLLKVAEMILVKPTILRRMTSYAMWQTAWESSTIYIANCELNQYQIYSSIFRQKQSMPEFGVIMPPKQKRIEMYENGI